MARYELRVSLGLFSLAVVVNDESLAKRLRTYYRDFITHHPPILTIEATLLPGEAEVPTLPKVSATQITFEDEEYRGCIDWQAKEASLTLGVRNPLIGVDYFLRVAAAVGAYSEGGMLIHAAGVVRDEKAYLFLGPSGAGKTTTARNSPPGSVLNDDLLVLYPLEGRWYAAATPFYNPTQNRPQAGCAPLAKMLFLVKDQKVYLESIPKGQALAEMIACIPVLTVEPFYLRAYLQRCQAILEQIPYYHLHLLPDDSYWTVLRGDHPKSEIDKKE